MPGYPHHHGHGPTQGARYATACAASAAILRREGRAADAAALEEAARQARDLLSHNAAGPDQRPPAGDEDVPGWWR